MDWQLFLVLLIAASSSAIAGLIVFLLGKFKIPPILFFLGIYAVVLIFQYFYAMYRSFKERKMKKLTVLAAILALFFILPYTAYAVRTPHGVSR